MRTTSGWWLLSMAEYFKRQGLPAREMFEQSGLPFQSLMYSNARFPQDGVTRLWQLAERLSGQDDIGFQVGAGLSVSSIPVLGQALISSLSLKDGFQRFFRYQKLVGEAASTSLNIQDDEVHLTLSFTGDEIPVCHHSYDVAMAATVSMIRVLLTEQWSPQAVHVGRAVPKAIDRFERFYRCPIHYSAKRDKLVLKREELEAESADFGSHEDSHWAPSILNLELQRDEKPVSSLLKIYLSQHLQTPGLDKRLASSALNISPRSLQRKLEKEGESYQALLDNIRKEKALEYMAVPETSLTAIAFLCGFSDVTAFNRAFKRWHGISPGNYRKQVL